MELGPSLRNWWNLRLLISPHHSFSWLVSSLKATPFPVDSYRSQERMWRNCLRRYSTWKSTHTKWVPEILTFMPLGLSMGHVSPQPSHAAALTSKPTSQRKVSPAQSHPGGVQGYWLSLSLCSLSFRSPDQLISAPTGSSVPWNREDQA